MTETDSHEAPRRRGAPQGNRNAWKHGKRSKAAKAARAAARAATATRLPDPALLDHSLRIVEAAGGQLRRDPRFEAVPPGGGDVADAGLRGEGEENAYFSANKTDKSGGAPGEGGYCAHFSRNETNNFVARQPAAKRGAPPGNRNALKHGAFSGQRREFDIALRNFRRRTQALCDLVSAMARERRRAP